ncbi:hypothetical protein Noda2021_00210 [Candidatus Dependentiae bacterium Noda2021]|nr:hypothetical protein Noda2021_00210 [Candidatus Dependentiae bacterium Noda2021]
MILGHGIDIVEISRFAHWHTYSVKQLSKVFTTQEISYCLSEPIKSAERFAARFAAKEAAYKAVCQLDTSFNMPFFSFCKIIEVITTKRDPILKFSSVDSKKIYCVRLSLSHSKENAVASVILFQL